MRAKLKSSQKRATQRTQNTVHSEGFEVRAQCENAKQAIAAPQSSCSRLPGRKEVALSRAEDNASSIREVVPEPQRGRVGRKPARSDPSPGFQPTTGSLGQKWPQFGFPARNRWFGLEEGEPTAAAPSPWSSTVRCLVTMK